MRDILRSRGKPHLPGIVQSFVADRRALITGVTGQDGSYLAELLLSKGYDVHGIVRRLSSPNIVNLAQVHDRLHILDADLIDQTSLDLAVKQSEPDEVYHLAAQSFVGASFSQPVLTGEVTGLGTIRLLEAVRHRSPHARVYQASSSEMFGRVSGEPQDEGTPFHPRSPYGVAKVYAYWAGMNYRESYGMHVSNGILFNHECFTSETPLILRLPSGMLDCLPIAEVLPDPNHLRQSAASFEVWDQGGFTRATLVTANWNGPETDRHIQRIVGRSGELRVTSGHHLITSEGRPVPAGKVPGSSMLLRTTLPPPPAKTIVSGEMAEFLGLMAGDGYVGGQELDKGERYAARFVNLDSALLARVQSLWEQLTGGWCRDSPGISGYTGNSVGGLRLNGAPGFLHSLRDSLYTRSGDKRVPRLILNANADAWGSFLRGYNLADGLRGGWGEREFKNFKTASPTLAAGLWWMASQVVPQRLTFNVDFVRRGELQERTYAYYSLNLGANGSSGRGRHLLRPSGQLKRAIPEPYVGWVYDVATESGTLHAGVGDLVCHNSERRGIEFVTRRISDGVARIATGSQLPLQLGNLDAKRDWGYAPEYVELMWRILQQPSPDNYVGATGESHTVREFVEEAFRVAGISDWESHVQFDSKLTRPSEVFNLRGDASKAQRVLGWTAKTRFKELVRIMVEADIRRRQSKPT